MADSTHSPTLIDKNKDKEDAYKVLSTALTKNHGSYCERRASYFAGDSTDSGHEDYCILGPYFFKEAPEAVQAALLRAQQVNGDPYACRETALITWSKKSAREFQWPQSASKSEWPEWVNRLKTSPFADHWKKAGTYDAIIMSTSNVLLDRSLVAAGLCFWNSGTNTMDLPGLGMMSLTLLDVAAITGFRPHGKEVSALTIPCHKILKLGADRYAYSNFIEHFKGKKKQQVTMEEHIAFLLYWLCKFVFCVASSRIIKERAGLAEALASFDDIALGPIVLAHLYRSLHKMVQQQLNGTTSGPIWLFQMWLQLYFPELAPPRVIYHQDQLLGASLVAATPLDHTPEECFNTLQHCTSRTDDQWSICLNRTYPDFLLWPSRKVSRDIWASFLTTRDLHLGVKLSNKFYSQHCGAELYCPNHFSRQLGCSQHIPVPVLSSVNMYSSWRKHFEDESQVKELSNNSENLLWEFKQRPYTKSFKSTNIFNSWWEKKMANISSMDTKHMSGGLCLHCSFNKRVPEEEDNDRKPILVACTEHPPSSVAPILPSKRVRSDGAQASNIIILDDDEEEDNNRKPILVACTEHPPSSAPILPSKRVWSDGAQASNIIILDDDEEEDDKEDEMSVANFLSKKHKRTEIQDTPPGFEQVESKAKSQQSETGIPPLRSPNLENDRTASPSASSHTASTARRTVLTFMNTSLSSPVDMEGFDRFKAALQVLMKSGDVSSIKSPMLHSQLQELEALLPDFKVLQREMSDVDEGLALLPNANFKMETSTKQCSKIEDRVNKLNSRLAELEAETALVRTERDQALGELNLELDMRAPIQRVLDTASKLEEKKNQLATQIKSTSKRYENTIEALKAQLVLDKVPANISNRDRYKH